MSEQTDESAPQAGEQGESADYGGLDFSTFVISLASNVSVRLDAGHKAHNPSLAQQTIDILDMLAAKTAGNLSEREQTLLDGVLQKSRMAYAEATKE